MTLVLNIRGTNGSGKSTLARAFLPPNLNGDREGGPVDLNEYDSPTKRLPHRKKRVEGYVHWNSDYGKVGVIGPYHTACGGMDALPSFAVCQGAIDDMYSNLSPDFIIAEGVLASTVYGSWAEYAAVRNCPAFHFAFCYLDTPLEVCLERIRERQRKAGREREIKEGLVADKVRAIAATRTKALADGHLVYDLPWRDAERAVGDIMTGRGDSYRAA